MAIKSIRKKRGFGNKKGIFFTFAAIALALVVIFSFQSYKEFDLKEEADVIGIRIESMNNFIKDVEQDLEKGLFISSFRAIASMSQFVANNGTYIANLDQSFEELVLEGTLNNQELSLMESSTFTDWTNKIKTQADKIDITINFTIISVSLNQTNPWFVSVSTNVSMEMLDKKNTSSWNRNEKISTEVSIENFEDPLYLVNTNGRVSNSIAISPFENFVVGDDISNLLEHLNKSYYISSNSSPSYLMRLQGDLSNSSVGIESLANLGKFQEQGISIKDRSVVDYIYFGAQSTTNYRINGTPSWFKLDQDHLETYQVQDLVIS